MAEHNQDMSWMRYKQGLTHDINLGNNQGEASAEVAKPQHHQASENPMTNTVTLVRTRTAAAGELQVMPAHVRAKAQDKSKCCARVSAAASHPRPVQRHP